MKRLVTILVAGLALNFAGAEPPPGDFEPGDQPPPPPVQELLKRWKDKDPEEFERMRALRESDPEEFRSELHRKLMDARQEHGRRHPEGERGHPSFGPPGDGDGGSPEMRALELKIKDLSRAWRETKDESLRPAIRLDLEKSLGEAFDQREQNRRERLVQMEKKLNELRTSLEQRRAKRAEIIGKRLKELTEGEPLEW